MHPWYLFNPGKCNSCLTFHLFRKSYHAFSIHILIHHTCASLAHFYIIHSYLFGLNISLHTGKPYNAFNPCTQAYTNIDKYSTCKFTACTFFHVIHTHGHFKLLYPSSQRSYNHSYDKSHRNTQHYVSLSVESLQSFTWKVSQTYS
jgi:hypothetical protein